MDIRSLLNDKDLAPKPSTAQKSGDAHSVVIPHLRSPIDIDCRGSWHTQQSTADRYIRNDSVHKRDSMSFSPKSEHAQPSGDLDSAPKSLPCYQCQKLFTRRSDLVRHERIHSGVRPHSCTYHGCGKSFIQRSALTIHERVHTGDKPHECLSCGKPFSDSSSLARHRRTHTGVRPYSCDFPGCGKDFTRKTTLSRHRQQHTTKGHVPASTGSVSAPSTSTLSSVSSYDDLRTPDNGSAESSPALQQKPGQGACYITFQISQPEERYGYQRQDMHYPPQQSSGSSVFRSHSYSAERPQLMLHRKPDGPALLSPPLDYPAMRHGSNTDAQHFSRQRPTLPHTSSLPATSYSGTPLPRIVAGWGNEHVQYGPISGADYTCQTVIAGARRDSAIGSGRSF